MTRISARLEMEADVEYLMVEAAHCIWKATGDLEAMRAPHGRAWNMDPTVGIPGMGR